VASRLRRQTFYDTAKRRVAEAKLLLEAPRASESAAKDSSRPRLWSCDGAVTCGLLAAECALKATLLHGHGADYKDELPREIAEDMFDTSRGHVLKALWDRQAARLKSTTGDDIVGAIERLNGLDRYQHRYGALKPDFHRAQPLVKCGELVVSWMQKVFRP
jgi:hypothetical protein